MRLGLMSDVVIETESSRPNESLLRLGGLPRRKCPCDNSTFSQCCPGFGLHSWMKVSNMATIMKLLHLRPFSSLLLFVFVGDHRQTPGGLSKGRAAAANRQKLLQRPLGLRALNRPGDYLPPARLASLVGLIVA